MSGEGDNQFSIYSPPKTLVPKPILPENSGPSNLFPSLKTQGGAGEGFTFKQKKLSSLVQRQSERQGIFLVALSPFKRGAALSKGEPVGSNTCRFISP